MNVDDVCNRFKKSKMKIVPLRVEHKAGVGARPIFTASAFDRPKCIGFNR